MWYFLLYLYITKLCNDDVVEGYRLVVVECLFINIAEIIEGILCRWIPMDDLINILYVLVIRILQRSLFSGCSIYSTGIP